MPILLLGISLATGARGQEVRSNLEGIVLDEQAVNFDSNLEVVADCTAESLDWPLPSPIGYALLSAKEISGLKLKPESVVKVYVFRGKTKRELTKEPLTRGHRYRLNGKLRDAFTFGGTTALHLEVTDVESLGEISPPPPAAPKIDREMKVGEMVELAGVLWSRNGDWWFEYDDEKWYLTSKKGRSLRFETEWHGIQVNVTGKFDRQLRASLRSARDLKMYSIVVGAAVEPANQPDGADSSQRFRVLYSAAPAKRNGVFDLIPEHGFRRNIIGNESDAMLFVERNGPWFDDIATNATPESLEVIAARMNDSEKVFALRLIYAGILAANNDERGRRFLIEQTLGQEELSRDALYVLGAFPYWVEKIETVNLEWVREPAAHCLKLEPTNSIWVSNVDRLWLRADPVAAQEALISLIENPSTDTSRELGFFSDFESSILIALLDEREATISTEHLVRLAKAFPEPEGNRRKIAERLLQRDEPIAADLFLHQLAEDHWYTSFRDNTGPKVFAEIRKRLPDLADSVRMKAEILLLRAEDDPAAKMIARLEDPATPLEDFNLLRWELRSFDDPRSAVPVARFLKDRILASPNPDGVSNHAVTSAIEGIGDFDTPEAVAAMIGLFDADYSGVTGKYLTAKEIRSLIAGQLAEMTGVSFGVDAAAWREYLSSPKRNQ